MRRCRTSRRCWMTSRRRGERRLGGLKGKHRHQGLPRRGCLVRDVEIVVLGHWSVEEIASASEGCVRIREANRFGGSDIR